MSLFSDQKLGDQGVRQVFDEESGAALLPGVGGRGGPVGQGLSISSTLLGTDGD